MSLQNYSAVRRRHCSADTLRLFFETQSASLPEIMHREADWDAATLCSSIWLRKSCILLYEHREGCTMGANL